MQRNESSTQKSFSPQVKTNIFILWDRLLCVCVNTQWGYFSYDVISELTSIHVYKTVPGSIVNRFLNVWIVNDLVYLFNSIFEIHEKSES